MVVTLLVEETRENQGPAICHWQTLSHKVVLNTPSQERDSNSQLYITTNCIGSYKSNYHTIVTMTALPLCTVKERDMYQSCGTFICLSIQHSNLSWFLRPYTCLVLCVSQFYYSRNTTQPINIKWIHWTKWKTKNTALS